jgi:septum formation protein
MTVAKLILASTSPRRSEILEGLGLAFAIRSVAFDEKLLPEETPAAAVQRLAVGKATMMPPGAGEVVIGADTAVVLDDRFYGKPRNEADCLAMLANLAGRTHQVMTGVAVATPERVATGLSITDVRFREIDPDEARRYWQSGEPRDKAGGYAIQGRGGQFVEAIIGSYTGVVGLPVFETAAMLRAAGIDVLPELKSGA